MGCKSCMSCRAAWCHVQDAEVPLSAGAHSLSSGRRIWSTRSRRSALRRLHTVAVWFFSFGEATELRWRSSCDTWACQARSRVSVQSISETRVPPRMQIECHSVADSDNSGLPVLDSTVMLNSVIIIHDVRSSLVEDLNSSKKQGNAFLCSNFLAVLEALCHFASNFLPFTVTNSRLHQFKALDRP